jgi:non-heme chloroperoxidase
MAAGAPTMPGQDAFGAIAEVVRILEADPATDWTKVDIERLRQHLIDMNEVVLRSEVKQTAVPGGLAMEVFDGLRKALAENRAPFYLDFASGPFYGFNRPGAKPIPGVIQNWWRQSMMGSAKAHYDGIKAFSETDFTDDLKKITVPVLVMHGDDDQIVPYADSAPLSAKLLKNGTLKTYKNFPHGMPTTHANTINADILAFLRSGVAARTAA